MGVEQEIDRIPLDSLTCQSSKEWAKLQKGAAGAPARFLGDLQNIYPLPAQPPALNADAGSLDLRT